MIYISYHFFILQIFFNVSQMCSTHIVFLSFSLLMAFKNRRIHIRYGRLFELHFRYLALSGH